MGTVLIDRYRVICPLCSYDHEFMVGAGMGDYHAVEVARRIHAQSTRGCQDDSHLTVIKLAVQEIPPP